MAWMMPKTLPKLHIPSPSISVWVSKPVGADLIYFKSLQHIGVIPNEFTNLRNLMDIDSKEKILRGVSAV
jgi:hypothetical protein